MPARNYDIFYIGKINFLRINDGFITVTIHYDNVGFDEVFVFAIPVFIQHTNMVILNSTFHVFNCFHVCFNRIHAVFVVASYCESYIIISSPPLCVLSEFSVVLQSLFLLTFLRIFHLRRPTIHGSV